MATTESTQFAGALPPPQGVEPTFENSPSPSQNIIALHTVCLLCVTLAVSTRLYTRFFLVKNVGLDDCMILDPLRACGGADMPVEQYSVPSHM